MCVEADALCGMVQEDKHIKKQEYPSIDTFFFHDSMASNESLSTVEKASTQAWAPRKMEYKKCYIFSSA